MISSYIGSDSCIIKSITGFYILAPNIANPTIEFAKRGTGTAALPVPVLLSHFQGGGINNCQFARRNPHFKNLFLK